MFRAWESFPHSKKLVLVLAGLLTLLLFLPKLTKPKESAEYRGVVQSPGGPVENAQVLIQGKGLQVVSDPKGEFLLKNAREGEPLSIAKPGFFIANSQVTREFLRINMRSVPTQDNLDYSWVHPREGEGNCFQCHEKIVEDWERSGHSHSASSRGFKEMFKAREGAGGKPAGWSLSHEYPEGKGVCAACHAPGVKEKDPALEDPTLARGVDGLGVHCDFCHKISGVRKQDAGLTHGRDFFQIQRPGVDQVFFGPIRDASRDDNSFAPVFKESLYCAACHEGTLFGVPGYTTWSEWKESPAAKEGKSCQQCHMAPAGEINFAPGHGGINRRPDAISSHQLLPGGILAMLRLSLRMDVSRETVEGAVRIHAHLTATGVGHRVPTGFIDRHLVLLVEAQDALGKKISSVRGPLLPVHAGQEWHGHPGFLFAKVLQVKGVEGPLPFWTVGPTVKDTRLEPGKPQALEWEFPQGTKQVKLKLIYRKFWKEQEKVKGWPDGDQVVLEKILQ